MLYPRSDAEAAASCASLPSLLLEAKVTPRVPTPPASQGSVVRSKSPLPAFWPRRNFTIDGEHALQSMWRNVLKCGQRCDALDSGPEKYKAKWFEARVVEQVRCQFLLFVYLFCFLTLCAFICFVLFSRKRGGGKELRVHFLGWESRFDEWISRDDVARLRPPYSKVADWRQTLRPGSAVDLKCGKGWHAARVDEVVGGGSDEFVLERVKLKNLKSRACEWCVLGEIALYSRAPPPVSARGRDACLCAVSRARPLSLSLHLSRSLYLTHTHTHTHTQRTRARSPSTSVPHDGPGSTSTTSEL